MPSVRLHWFLPSRPKASSDEGRTRRFRQRLRRLLERIGPTWAASPLRRSVQAGCLGLFLVLLFYVCWPYEAAPAPRWNGWIPVAVDTVTGRVIISTDSPPSDPLAKGQTVFVVDADNGPSDAFRVVESKGSELTLEPIEALSPATLERLSTSFGPWSLAAEDPSRWPSYYSDDLASKQKAPAWIFLVLDPLVSLSTALATRAWIWSLGWAAAILLVCLVIPRGFCGYLCPLGTLIDLFDWAFGRRVSGVQLSRGGWWARLRYVFLAGVLFAAACGFLLTGFVAAIPVVTRGLVFLVAPLQNGLVRGWYQVPPMNAGHWISIGLFVGVFALSLLGPRFWCRYVCPTGAIFSLGNLLRLHERKVSDGCIECGRCAAHCPFGAIDPDFTTQTTECTFCQTCGGVCPAEAITFSRRSSSPRATASEPSSLGRRGFLTAGLSLTVGSLGGAGMMALAHAPGLRGDAAGSPLIRPPGSVPEEDFARMCVRCGECLRVCPNDVLQPLGLGRGLEQLWTPQVVADWAGCEQSCNRCGHVCPTGAIRALPLEEKRVARMGLAVIDQQACLPYAGRSACQLCADVCTEAGYRAIEFVRVGTQLDAAGKPIDDTGFVAPVVRPEHCVGCGQCQSRCYAINVERSRLLTRSAIFVEAGEGKEDRLRNGSYRALREAEKLQQEKSQKTVPHDYLPDFLQ
jgi:ferredoxin